MGDGAYLWPNEVNISQPVQRTVILPRKGKQKSVGKAGASYIGPNKKVQQVTLTRIFLYTKSIQKGTESANYLEKKSV
jgi:hypothetical protein